MENEYQMKIEVLQKKFLDELALVSFTDYTPYILLQLLTTLCCDYYKVLHCILHIFFHLHTYMPIFN